MSALAVGNAVQVGLMALDGYFDAAVHCGVLFPWHYDTGPDWQVSELVDRGAREFYRFGVWGLNHSARDTIDERFSWSVPSLCWRFFWLESEAS